MCGWSNDCAGAATEHKKQKQASVSTCVFSGHLAHYRANTPWDAVDPSDRVIVNPQNRERVTFLRTGFDTDGELLQMESLMEPGGFVGAEHIHPRQESRFLVLDGRPSFRVEGRAFTLEPGDRLVVPKGVPHKFWNETEGQIRMIIEFRPALRTQQFFEVFFGLSREGLTDGECARNRLQRAVLFSAYFKESRPVGVPAWRLFARRMLAPLGRLLGYRAWYPRYSGADVEDPLSLEQAV